MTYKIKIDVRTSMIFYMQTEDYQIGRCTIDDSGHLGIHIDEAYQNRGYGQKLLSKAIRYAKKIGLKRITLNVKRDNNRAIHIYRKLGFKKVSLLAGEEIMRMRKVL